MRRCHVRRGELSGDEGGGSSEQLAVPRLGGTVGIVVSKSIFDGPRVSVFRPSSRVSTSCDGAPAALLAFYLRSRSLRRIAVAPPLPMLASLQNTSALRQRTAPSVDKHSGFFLI